MSLAVVFIRSKPGFGGDAPIPLGTKTPVRAGATVFLGRSVDAQVSMPDGTVAWLYVLLTGPDQLRFVVTDLGRTKGTHAHGEQREVAILAPGEEFRIANRYWFRVVNG